MRTLLIANRGEIARRIIRTCRAMDIAAVAVYSSADGDAPHVAEAYAAVLLPGPPETAYLDREAIVAAGRLAGADAVHPGYGFLAEDAGFAAAVIEAGMVFVGPPPAAIAAMADKLQARSIAAGAGIPVVPGGSVEDAGSLTFPVLVKAATGGGGRGMRRVDHPGDLDAAMVGAARQAAAVFGDDRVYLEELIDGVRHIEVQVLADLHSGVIHLHDRECSVQRRHQKVIEEAPVPGLDQALRAALADAACRLAREVGYVGVGTVEFLVAPGGGWWFLEMNTRLQVEHPVTEMVTGVDLVAQQIRIARGEELPAQSDVTGPSGHAIEARLLAEDPHGGDLPQTGLVDRFQVPVGAGVRVDAGVVAGSVVTPFYDSLLAKVIAAGPDRPSAAALLASTLLGVRVHGIVTNRDLLVRVLRHRDFVAGGVDVGWLDRIGAEVRRRLLTPPMVEAACAAAALVLAGREREGAVGMASIPAGFRNVPGDPEVRSFRVGEERVDVAYRLEPAGARVGDAGYQAARLDRSGRVDLVVGGVRRRFEVTVWPDRVMVDTTDGSVELVEVPRFRPPVEAPASGSLTAPVPGRVVAAVSLVGDRVETGTTLVVIESMKLEHTVVAAEAGTVRQVAAVGDSVLAGQVVAVVDPG